MIAADDNVTPLPTLLQRIAARAAQAMDEYKAGEADQSKGRERSIRAIIDYGHALLDGREGGIKGRSNQAFGQWVTDNKLDVGKPWDNRAERHAAMKIAEIVVGSTPDNDFDDCPNTRPADIMKWYRKAHPEAKRQQSKGGGKRTRQTTPIINEVVKKHDEGKSSNEIAAEHNVGGRAVRHELHDVKIRREAFEELLGAAAAKNFLEKGALRIEDAIRIQKKQHAKQFEQTVNAEVRRRIDSADDATREQNKQLRAENLSLHRIVGERGVFTEKQYRQLLMLCHPDDSASPHLKAELLQILMGHKIRLVKPA